MSTRPKCALSERPNKRTSGDEDDDQSDRPREDIGHFNPKVCGFGRSDTADGAIIIIKGFATAST